MLLNRGVEKALESPLDCEEIPPVNPKGNQSWIGRTDAEAEAPIIWPLDAKNWLIGKDPDAEKDWRQEEKGTTEDEAVGWHHQLNGHEFEQTLGDDGGQKPGVLQSMGSQRVGHHWVTEQQQQYIFIISSSQNYFYRGNLGVSLLNLRYNCHLCSSAHSCHEKKVKGHSLKSGVWNKAVRILKIQF